MKHEYIAKLRLHNQRISHAAFAKPGDVVRWLGAVQAQDYLASLWAIGLRMKKATEKDIEKAIANKEMVRTWPMRRTLHFVAPEDVRWMLKLMASRMVAGSKNRTLKMYGLTDEMVNRGKDLFTKALEKEKILMRDEMYKVMEKGGIDPVGGRGLHLLCRIAQEGLICFGPRKGKQATFVLIDQWIPKCKEISRDEALGELVLRYFTSHGPATVQDCMWWSSLPGVDIKRGIEIVGSKLMKVIVEGKTYWMSKNVQSINSDSLTTYLLPAFDEYFVAYKDREAVLHTAHKQHINPGNNGMLSPTIVVNGQIVGTWKREFKGKGAIIKLSTFMRASIEKQKSLKQEANRYGVFLSLPVSLS
jgi:hypothetical protein